MMFEIGDIVKDKMHEDYLLVVDNDRAEYIALLLYCGDGTFSGIENNVYRRSYLESFFVKVA